MRPDAPSEAESEVRELSMGPVGLVDSGEGHALVAVHGLPGSVRDYRWLAPALEGGCRLIRVDMPGFGKTPASASGFSVDARGAFVAQLIEDLDLNDAVVIGHSMGGPVAASAALRSDRVAALGLIASVGTTPHVAFRRAPGMRAASYTLHVGPFARRAMPFLRKQFASMGFRGVSDDAILQTCFILARFRFTHHRRNLAALRKPTLVAWAADDKLVEDAISDKLYWAAPVGPRVRFPDGGHNIQATRATELSQTLLAWFDTL